MFMGTDRKLRLLLVTVRPGVNIAFHTCKFNSGIKYVGGSAFNSTIRLLSHLLLSKSNLDRSSTAVFCAESNF